MSTSLLALLAACGAPGAALAQSAVIPLHWVPVSMGGGTFIERLGITVGLGSGAPKPYLFDTGSTSFNAASDPRWFPAPSVIQSDVPYLYGNGNHGFVLDLVTLPSATFYRPDGSAPVYTVQASEGFRLARIDASILEGTLNGASPLTIGGRQYYADPAWAAAVTADTAPYENAFYGIFGADASVTSLNGSAVGGILGQATTSGYVVSANGKAAGCGPCVILGLTPELRAQFGTVIPWASRGPAFPVSGANGATEFALPFAYSLSAPGLVTVSWSGRSLLDTGTPEYQLTTSRDVSAFLGAQTDQVLEGVRLAYGPATGAGETNAIIAAGGSGAQTNVVYVNGLDHDILGVGFFQSFAVMYDLENEVTGYTSNRIAVQPFTSAPRISAKDGPLGFAGAISGASPLVVESGGQATLSAANPYTGATRIAKGGFLGLAGPGSIAASSRVQVNGTLDISRTPSGARLTTLAGHGTVALGSRTLGLTDAAGRFSGTLTDGGIGGGRGGSLVLWGGDLALTGASTYTGGTAIAAGAGLTLTGSVRGSIVNNGVLHNQGVVGKGVVNQGILVNDGRIGGDVRNAGVLSGHGRVGSLTSARGSTIAPGNSIGTTAVDGDLTLADQATYAVEVDRQGVSDRIAVGGAANLSGQAVVSLAGPRTGVPALGTRYTILTAQGGVNGMFSRLDDSAMLAAGHPFLDTALAYEPRRVSLSVVRSSATFASFGATANQVAAGAGADALPVPTGGGPGLVASLAALDGSTAPAAYDALSGEIHASAATAGYRDARLVESSLLARLRDPSDRPALAAGTDPVLSLDPRRFVLWGDGFGSWGRVRSNGNAASLASSTGGFILGAEARPDPDLRLGLAAGLTTTSFDVDGRLSSGSSDSVFGALYGSQSWGAVAVRLGALFARHDIDTNRAVLFPGFADVASGSYEGSTMQAFGEIGYRLDVGEASIEPFVGASILRLRSEGFREQGGPSALIAFGQSNDLAATTLGLRGTFAMSRDLPVTLKGLIGWRHAYGDIEPETLTSFAGAASAFRIAGVPVDRDALVVEAGLDWQASQAIRLGVAYAGQVGTGAQDHALKGNFTWRFATR